MKDRKNIDWCIQNSRLHDDQVLGEFLDGALVTMPALVIWLMDYKTQFSSLNIVRWRCCNSSVC
jgi:hypothetical protein